MYFNLFIFFECFSCMCVYIAYVFLVPIHREEEDVRSLGTVTGGCEQQYRGYKLNPGLLLKQQMLLTTKTSLQYSVTHF